MTFDLFNFSNLVTALKTTVIYVCVCFVFILLTRNWPHWLFLKTHSAWEPHSIISFSLNLVLPWSHSQAGMLKCLLMWVFVPFSLLFLSPYGDGRWGHNSHACLSSPKHDCLGNTLATLGSLEVQRKLNLSEAFINKSFCYIVTYFLKAHYWV